MASHNTYIAKDLLREVPDYSKTHKQDFKTVRPGKIYEWGGNIFTADGAMMGYAFDVTGDIAKTQLHMISKYYRLNGSPKIRYSYYRGPEPWVTQFIRFMLYDAKKKPITGWPAGQKITEEDETFAAEIDSTGAVYFRMSCYSGFSKSIFDLNIQIQQYK